MTTVISYVTELFSIIITDNRINFGPNQEGGYEDGHLKLINLKDMGWASGAGLSDFLDEIKNRLSTKEIRTTDDIKKEFSEALKMQKSKEPYFVGYIEESVVVTSWLGATESNIFLRVGALSEKHFGTSIVSLEKGLIDIVYPGDYLDYVDKISVLKEKHELKIEQDDFGFVLKSMFKIFKHISLNSNQVSKTCDVGIMIFLEDGLYKLKISGEIKELIDELTNGNINSRIEVISAITL